jgi:hypothetical protein
MSLNEILQLVMKNSEEIMEHQNLKIKAIVYTVLLQLIIMILVFFGGLLDPLLGIIVVGINFLILNTFFAYKFFLEKVLNN